MESRRELNFPLWVGHTKRCFRSHDWSN